MFTLHIPDCISSSFLLCPRLTLAHTRSLKLSEDVLGVCHSPNGRLLAVALLDSTIKVFFTDTLKVCVGGVANGYGVDLVLLSSSSCHFTAISFQFSLWTSLL